MCEISASINLVNVKEKVLLWQSYGYLTCHSFSSFNLDPVDFTADLVVTLVFYLFDRRR